MLSIPAVNCPNSAEFRTIYQRRIVTRTEMRLRQLSIRSRFAISCSQSVLPRFLHVPRDAHSSPSFALSISPFFIRPLISFILSSVFPPFLFIFQACRAKFSNLNSDPPGRISNVIAIVNLILFRRSCFITRKI